jgi:hypothetical protein
MLKATLTTEEINILLTKCTAEQLYWSKQYTTDSSLI